MAQIKGTCTKIHKNGRYYSIVVDDKWYGTGDVVPDFEEGSMVSFKAVENDKGYWNVTKGTLEVMGKAASTSGKSRATSSRIEHTDKKEQYFQEKAERDKRNDEMREIGAGRNTAIEFVKLLVTTEALTLPAKKDAKADALFEAVEYYRGKFAANNYTIAPIVEMENVVKEDDAEEEDEDYE